MDELEAKLGKLGDILARTGSVLIAYSGGADSTFLLKVALDVLGENVLAATARAPIFLSSELATAEEMAHRLRARHLFVETSVLDDPNFSCNPPDRCYICKRALFSRLRELASKHNLNRVIEGSNRDDLGEYRPGLRAMRELAVKSPLAEAGFSKAEIRSLSQEMGLPTWNKPAQTCLATRFPYGERLTPKRLKRVEEAEGFLHSLDFGQVRVRDHGVLARIEVAAEDMVRLLELAPQVVDRLKESGYTYITLDLEGHRTGSMDEILKDRRPS